MKRAEIQKLFLLENDPQLFDDALCPRSCGGGAKFERLALYGDRVLDIHLFDYLIEIEGRQLKGDITTRKGTIHHWYPIKVFADDLGIPDILPPLHHPGDNDWKEIVEALIGAAFKVNGLERCAPIIKTFIDSTQKRQATLQELDEFDISMDYISELNNLPKDYNSNIQSLHLKTSGPDHSKIYQYEGDVIIDGTSYKITTDEWPKEKVAFNEAAYRILRAIKGNNAEHAIFGNTQDNMPLQEKTVYSKTSIDDEELTFRKSGAPNESIEVSQNTGESLVEYIDRKAKKNVFKMLKLLSARLDNVIGASWICDLSSDDVLVIINLQLEEQNYFAFGFGPSNTQARKAAGKDLLMKVNLKKWIEENYLDYKI